MFHQETQHSCACTYHDNACAALVHITLSLSKKCEMPSFCALEHLEELKYSSLLDSMHMLNTQNVALHRQDTDL